MWIEPSENKELSATLLLDQTAAYDLVDHDIFLQKLKVYNFDDATMEWFKSYLSGRSQVVQVESKRSSCQALADYGVPQGSILGGLIFIIFSNDFPESASEGDSVLYVDDDTDVVSHDNPVELNQKIQYKADNSVGWLRDNRMCVAGKKSKLLIIGTRQLRASKLTQKMSVNVEAMEVEETKSEKLLGLVINNELTWHEHLYGETWRVDGENSQGLIPQLSQRVGMLKRMSRFMSKKTLALFTNGLFYSKLNYCLPVFGHVFGLDTYCDKETRYSAYTKEDNRKLQVLQNKLLRLLSDKDARTPTATLLNLTESLSIQQKIALQTLTMVHKIVYNGKPIYLAKKLKFQEESRQVRSQMKLCTIDYKLSNSRAGFTYRGSKLFNNLPQNLRTEANFKKFKVQVEKWVVENVQAKPS